VLLDRPENLLRVRLSVYLYPGTLSCSAWLTGYYDQDPRPISPHSDRISCLLERSPDSAAEAALGALGAFQRAGF
jgi:hypothetical protein